MAKRKRDLDSAPKNHIPNGKESAPSKIIKTNGHADVKTPGPTIQIVVGSYERVLHGITAGVSNIYEPSPSIEFANSFLFNAHASAIKCIALSPLPDTDDTDGKSIYLATGGSDERINVYSLSASYMSEKEAFPALPTLTNDKISENPLNRELGSLLQHSSNITALNFPTRSKLLSAAEDNTISISRTKDLTVVSTIKAPRPKTQGQPSGDTAPPGATPAGVNDFAVHPSLKLMVSVGRGEKTMRLWNLVTGRKASVLNFDREILQAVRESKYSSGEGRKIKWNNEGSEFAVAFERGVVIFGNDAKAKCTILPQPLTKVHAIIYATLQDQCVLAVSTEDGRVIFYNTDKIAESSDSSIPSPTPIAQIGGKPLNLTTRVKDFKILPFTPDDSANKGTGTGDFVVVTGSSDGAIRLWLVMAKDLATGALPKDGIKPVGKLLGIYETNSRITCLDAFVMLPPTAGEDSLSEFDELTGTELEDDDSSNEEDR